MSDVTSSAVANLNNVFTLLFERKILVKRCNAVNRRFAYAEFFRKIWENFGRKITVSILRALKNRYKRAFLRAEFRYRLVEDSKINSTLHSISVKSFV